MPLTNTIIAKLNEITTTVENKNSLRPKEIEEIKSIFKHLLEKGENYNVEEIESWFENEGTWNNKKSIVRITNISHYILTKHEQTQQFRILSDDESCSCN